MTERLVLDHRNWTVKKYTSEFNVVAPELYTFVELEDRKAKYREMVVLKNDDDMRSRNVIASYGTGFIKITGLQTVKDEDYLVINELGK